MWRADVLHMGFSKETKGNQKNRPFGLWFVARNSASTACRPTKVVAK